MKRRRVEPMSFGGLVGRKIAVRHGSLEAPTVILKSFFKSLRQAAAAIQKAWQRYVIHITKMPYDLEYLRFLRDPNGNGLM